MGSFKRFFEHHILSAFVGMLIISQIVLVIMVVVNVRSSNRLLKQSEQFYEECSVYLDSLRSCSSQSDSTHVVVPLPQEELPPREDESTTILSIFLALITLCVTLSIVIPYVEGKSMTENKIKHVASSYYKEAFESIEQYYSETNENAMWEEAHFSRMIAYLLQKSSDVTDMYWSIGWASKAIIRYIKCPDKYHKTNFIENSISYINKAATLISGISGTTSENDKLLRAFVDAFDAYVLIKCEKCLLHRTEKLKEMENALLLLYKALMPSSEDEITDLGKLHDFVQDELNKSVKEKSKFYTDKSLYDNKEKHTMELEDFFSHAQKVLGA